MGKIISRYLMPHPPIIVPAIGMGEERKAKSTVDSMKEIAKELKTLKPKTIVIITPHGPLFSDAVAISDVEHINGDFSRFGNDQIALGKKINTKLTRKIIENIIEEEISVVPIDRESEIKYDIRAELDHGSLVPLYYIEGEYSDYDLVHITYGMLSKIELYKIGMIISNTIKDMEETVAIIASGDLSHKLKETGPYEYSESGSVFDKEVLSLLENGDTESIYNMDKKLIEEAGECALRSIYILLGTLDKCKFEGDLLSYEGTFGVGYGVMKIKQLGDTSSLLENIKNIEKMNRDVEIKGKASSDIYVILARKSLENYLKNDTFMKIQNDLPDVMTREKRGVFVSFKMDGELRGCIGTIFPASNCIAREIITNSIEAGTRDPRFHPINLEELPYLEISVDELMEPEPSRFEELDPKVYGVIVKSGRKRGLLLPDLEGVDSKEEQVNIALSKAGIEIDEDYEIERFKVIRHK